MKAHTQTFKENLITLGKEIDAKVTYTIDGVETELSGDELGSVTPHYEGNILKSVMKQVDIISDIDIPLNTEINVQFGMRYDTDEYEYIDYGNYIVFSSQKQEDTNNYKIIAYDKMLYAMKDYEELEITYPITIRDYISAICTKIGLEFANANDMFANYDKEIKQDLYANLGYTFRDVLDEIAQVTASTICINQDDKLEVRYLNESVNESQEVEGTNLTLSNSESAKISGVEIEGEITQETTTGKNLLDTSLLPLSNHGLTISRNNNGDIVINGTPDYSSGYVTFRLGNGKTLTPNTYTLSVDTKKVGIGMSVGGFGGRLNLTLADTVKSKTQTSTENYYIQPDLNIRYDVGTLNNFILNPQLEISSTPTSYEPFTNGPSPNPEYPQNVEITTGRQEIDICGKNILPQDKYIASTTKNGITFTNNGDGTFNLIGTATANTTIQILPPGEIELEVNQPYYLYSSVPYNGTTFNMSIPMTDNGTTKFLLANNTYTPTATPTNERLQFYIANGQSINQTNIKMMLIKGNTAPTTYEPYIGKEHEINLGKNLYPYEGMTNQYTLIMPCYIGEKFTLSFKGSATSSQRVFLRTYNGNNAPTSTMVDNEIIYVNTTPTNYSKTLTSTINGYLYVVTSVAPTNYTFENIQIERGSIATSFSPYFTPIFLGKINDYKDFIRRGNGKNMFNINATPLFLQRVSISISNNSITQTNSGNYARSEWSINGFEIGQEYTIHFDFTNPNRSDIRINIYDSTNTTQIAQNSSSTQTSGNMSLTFNATETTQIIRIYTNTSSTSNTSSVVLKDIQLEKGNTQTEYEPYGFKDKWYLYKAIGKVVLNGSESGDYNITVKAYIINANAFSNANMPNYTSNYFTNYFGRNNISAGGTNEGSYWFNNQLRIRVNTLSTSVDYQTWLSNHNTEAYYPLATPTITEITSSNYPELYSQLKALDNAKTYEGVTNISSTFPIKFSYATEYETIDEDYIKNTRADFGEKYGPINSIVLSRSADSDNIYIQDQDSIDENGLCEVKIKDNQIMNDNDRSDFLPDLLEYLKYIEYYINDFESIGITYLDLLDRYKVVIGDKSYYCVMFNDEVGIHDGLNEIIYTEKPKQNVTDYKKASTTDKQERQTYLMVDKQAQRIDALISDEDENFSRIQVEIDNISSQVQSTNVELDELGEEIEVVRSSITEQTSEAITDWFNTALKPTIEDLENSVDSNDQTLNEIKSYVRRGVITDPQSPYYNQAFVELGDTTNQTTLRILPNRIQFLTNGQETAFISNNQLYINESTILTKEKIGNWVTTQDENGLLNTYWED